MEIHGNDAQIAVEQDELERIPPQDQDVEISSTGAECIFALLYAPANPVVLY